jgi:hypothetical protein
MTFGIRPVMHGCGLHDHREGHWPFARTRLLIWCQVRSEFFVALIPCALSHFLWSAWALVSAAVLGRLAGLRFGVDILITRDMWLAPVDPLVGFTEIWSGCRADQSYHSPIIVTIDRLSRGAPRWFYLSHLIDTCHVQGDRPPLAGIAAP